MKNKSKIFSKQYIGFYLAFLLPIFLMLIVFRLVELQPFGEKTLMSGDYIHQYIPIYRSLGDMLREFDFTGLYWSWSKGLGGSMASVYAFNGLSPITLVLGLVPLEWLNITVFMMTLLRNGLAGLTFYYFLYKRYNAKNNLYLSLIAAIAYAMNGFLITNQVNPNFLDNIILLPLLMIGVEKILSGEKSLKYSLILAGMIVIHFYTAYMVAVFVVIYSIYYLMKKTDIKNGITALLRLAGYSFLGVGLSAIFILPVFYALLDTKVVSGEGEKWIFEWLYSPAVLVLKFFMGANGGINEWADSDVGPNFYVSFLALLALLKVLMFRTSKKELWANIFIFVTFLIFFTNAAGQKFMHMGQMPFGFYHRNAFILSFFFALLIYQVFNEKLDWSRKNLFAVIGVLGSFVLVHLASKNYTYPLVETWQYVYALVILVIFSLLIFTKVKNEIKLKVILVLVMIDMTLNGTTSLVRIPNYMKVDYMQGIVTSDKESQVLDELSSNLSRVEKSYASTLNDPLLFNYNGINHFTSSIEVATSKYLGNMGISSSKNVFIYSSSSLLTDALINLKYIYKKGPWEYTSQANMENLYNKTSYENILENPYTLGLAFSADKSIKYLTMENSKPVLNQNNLMKEIFDINEEIFTLVPGLSLEYDNLEPDASKLRLFKKIDPNKPAKISIKFTPVDDNSYYILAPNLKSGSLHNAKFKLNNESYRVANRFDHAQLWNLASQASGKQQNFEMEINAPEATVDFTDVGIYKFDNEKFISIYRDKTLTKWSPEKVESNKIIGSFTQVPDKDYVVTSIPYNSGWSIEVDGKQVKTEKVLGSMIGFELAPGEHEIVMNYTHPGLISGSIVSIFSLLIFLYLVRKNKNSKLSSQL